MIAADFVALRSPLYCLEVFKLVMCSQFKRPKNLEGGKIPLPTLLHCLSRAQLNML